MKKSENRSPEVEFVQECMDKHVISVDPIGLNTKSKVIQLVIILQNLQAAEVALQKFKEENPNQEAMLNFAIKEQAYWKEAVQLLSNKI